MAFEAVEVKSLKDMLWGRVLLAALAMSLACSLMAAAGGTPLRALMAIFLLGTAWWFVVLTAYYWWTIRRDGPVLFPEPLWHQKFAGSADEEPSEAEAEAGNPRRGQD